MHLFLKITLLVIAHNAKQRIIDGKCFNPKEENYYAPKLGLCIYGINYKLNDGIFSFDEKLYFNYDQLFNDSDITLDEFEIAAKPLCDKIENDTYENKNVTHYYGAWVRTKENTYKDMFMGCCESCQVLNEIEWLIKLKVQLLARSKFGYMRQDMLLYREKMNSYFDTFYFMYQQNLISVPTCESPTYDLIPVLLGNYVGFAGAFDRLGWESLLLRTIAPARQESVSYIGWYTAAIANKYKRNHCINSYASKADTVCLVYVLSTKYYGYECCCYGSRIPQCQERIRNSVMTGSSISTFRGRKMACIIDEDSIDSSSKVNYSTDGIEFKGDVHNLMRVMGREFCELHLKLDDSKQTNVSFNSDHIMKRHALLYQKATDVNKKPSQFTLPLSNNTNNHDVEEMNYHQKLIQQYINITNSFQCINISNWDDRAHDILRFNCAQLLPLDAQCPFSSSRTSEYHQHIMCCCNHRPFCNYNADIIKRANSKSIPNLCEYNNEYQYFLHDYFYPTYSNATHSCLLHFVSKNALRDMNLYLPTENSIVFFLPGSAIQPIDFSYALLEPNKCDYIDVDLKYDYLRTRYCYKSTALLQYFDTRFMPMRLFACRCVTKPGETPCDSILKQSIAEKAKASDRKYYCAVYNDQNTIMFSQKPQLKVNDLSPYCTTMIDFKTVGNNFYYAFSGNTARRIIINRIKFKLAMIPYTMYTLSGETTELCMHLVVGEMILCICRNEYENRKIPCNLNSQEKGKALKVAIYEWNLPKTRKVIPNSLITYTTKNEPKWCFSESIFSTIIIDNNQKETMITSECVKKTSRFIEEKSGNLLCAEKLFHEECGIISVLDPKNNVNEESIVCCCDDNCDLIGLHLHEFQIDIRLLMKNDEFTNMY
ncbi:Threonine--tRNA ligase [Dirofilaria immitis]